MLSVNECVDILKSYNFFTKDSSRPTRWYYYTPSGESFWIADEMQIHNNFYLYKFIITTNNFLINPKNNTTQLFERYEFNTSEEFKNCVNDLIKTIKRYNNLKRLDKMKKDFE